MKMILVEIDCDDFGGEKLVEMILVEMTSDHPIASPYPIALHLTQTIAF